MSLSLRRYWRTRAVRSRSTPERIRRSGPRDLQLIFDPTNAGAYLNRGSAQVSAGEVALALSDYNTALHLKPDFVEAWYNRGKTPWGASVETPSTRNAPLFEKPYDLEAVVTKIRATIEASQTES